MDALNAAGLCALLLVPAHSTQPCAPVIQVSNPSINRWELLIEAASKRFGIPVEWIRAVMARESAGHTTLNGAPIISRSGAMGLMQLMPATWFDIHLRYRLGDDPFDPHDNIFAGTAYLHEMFDRYGYPLLFAAYHAGPGRLDAVLAGQKPLPETTKFYLESIAPGAKITGRETENLYSTLSESVSGLLFFVRVSDQKSPANSSGHAGTASDLFVPLASQPPLSNH